MDSKLQQWLMDNKPSDEMVYKEAFWNNNIFLRDKLLPMFFWSDEYSSFKKYPEFEVMLNQHHDIIGTHHSKSIRMPVLRFVYKDCTIVLRYNFYDYEVAIISGRDINLPTNGLFQSKETSFYYQGFPEEYQLKERYEDNKRTFMANIRNNYDCYTFFYLLKNELDH